MAAGGAAPPALELAVVRTSEELAEALAVRRAVFVEEQGVPLFEELDEFDVEPGDGDDVVHLLGCLDGRAICTGRVDLAGERGASAHITRVAVLREHRGRGLGVQLMEALHAEARARGMRAAELNAQLQALGFYERLGYRAHGPVFLDAGIEHRAMELAL
jgi:predicted GNAT family N-acyltransferase